MTPKVMPDYRPSWLHGRTPVPSVTQGPVSEGPQAWFHECSALILLKFLIILAGSPRFHFALSYVYHKARSDTGFLCPLLQGILYLNQDVPKELLEFLSLRHFPTDPKASSWG